MTLKKKIGVDAYGFDVETGEQLSHSEIYGKAIEAIGGLDVVIRCIPFPLDRIKEAIKKDAYLNNLPLRAWDRAGIELQFLFKSASVSPTPAECVCTLKEAARRWAEREET